MSYASVLALALTLSNVQADGTAPQDSSRLEELILAEVIGLPEPLTEYHLTYDASSGFDHAIPMTASITYRGETAEEVRKVISEKGEEAALDEIKSRIMMRNKRFHSTTLETDEANGNVTVRMNGVVEMSWFVRPETKRLSNDFINDVVTSEINTTLDPAWEDDDFVSLSFPSHRKMTQVVILPLGGKGFSLQGSDLNLQVANTEITRSLAAAISNAHGRRSRERLLSIPRAISLIIRGPSPMPDWNISTGCADLEKTLEIDADHYGASEALAWLDAWQGRHDSALAMADKIIADHPETPGGYVIRAELLRQFGRKQEARPFYDRGFQLAVKGDTAEWDSWDDMKWSALIGSGQIGRALRLANMALRKTPDNAKLLNVRCWVRGLAVKNLEKALKDCERAVALAPDDKELMEGPGFILYRQGRFAEAVTALDRVVERSPVSTDAYFIRGLAKLNLGESGSGEADIRTAKTLQFDVEKSYASYGITRP